MPGPQRKVLRLTGELDLARRDEIAAALRLGGYETGVLLDFADVTYADSTILAELLRFRGDAERAVVPIVMVIGSRQFARLIQYAGLSHAFTIFDDRAKALTYLNGLEAQ